MRSCKNLFVVVFAVAVIGAALRANADLMDSSTFPYKYEMDVDPTNVGLIDLDSNSSADLISWTSGGSMVVSGGILTINGSGTNYAGYNTDNGTSGAIWQQVGATIASGYEFEARIKVDSSTGTLGACAIVLQPLPNPNATDGATLLIGASGESWGYGGDVDHVELGTEDNSSDFHTFRVVAASGGGDGAYSVYRDGVLLAGGLNAGYAGEVNAIYAPVFQLGAVAGVTHGVTEVDYLRFTPTGPTLPEPGTLVLLATGLVGLLAYAWKKRK